MANAFQHRAFQGNAFQEDLNSGILYAVDQTDSASIVGTISGGQGILYRGGFKKRLEKLHKKLQEAELQRLELRRADALKRKESIKELVDPSPKVSKRKQNKVELKQQVEADIPSVDIQEINKVIANLEKQKRDLFKSIALKQEAARIAAELAILEASRLAELDDEEALLLLI